jgi:hypothetical protein
VILWEGRMGDALADEVSLGPIPAEMQKL